MKELYVVNCCRTAIGSFGGALKNDPCRRSGCHRHQRGSEPCRREAEQVDEVMFGCILTAAQGQNVARQAPSRPASPIPSPLTPWAWSAAPA